MQANAAMTLKKTLQTIASTTLATTLCAVSAAPALAQNVTPPAALKKTLQLTVHTAGQAVPLALPAGQVVQLRMAGENVRVDLRDAQGQHLRRLAEPERGVQTAIWLSQGAAQEQLWATPVQAGQPATLSVELLKTWPSDGTAPLQAESTSMGPQLQALQQQLAAGGTTEAFWAQVQAQGAPLVEPWRDGQQLVTFLWREDRHKGNTNVRLFGSPSGDHNPLHKLAGSDVWWTSAVMDPRARLSYALAPDVPQIADAKQQRRMILATLQRDPLNRATFPAQSGRGVNDVYQGRSVLTLPQAPAQPWVAARAGVPAGTLTRHTMHSQVLGNDRDVWTYVPAGVTPATQQGLLVLFDAHAFVHDVPTPRILDNLIADGLLPPMAAVIVGNASPEARGEELPPNPKFAQFMATELMPWVQAQGLGQLARHTVVAGSSYGGLVSSYLGLTHPELFGNVLSMSGSYWWAPEGEQPGWMQRAWQMLPSPVPNVRFYLDAGWYESGRGGRPGILETSRALGDILSSRGLAVTRREWVSGHDYVQWQHSLPCGLVALLAPQHLQAGDARLASCAGVPIPQ